MQSLTPLVALLATVLLTGCVTDSPEAKKPNIVILLADDLGYGELGSYGQQDIKTPNLDALAKKGVRFTDFYAGAPLCSPSRAVLMTGIHAGRVSIRGNQGLTELGWDRVPLRTSEVTLGEMFKQAGYQTAFIGKWHLENANDFSTWAHSRGFDYAAQDQWSQRKGKNNKKFHPLMQFVNSDSDGILYDPEDYDCLDVFRTNLALKYLDEQRDTSKPFFLFMSYRTPHGQESYIREKELYADRGWPEEERRHAARITMLDQQIQRLLDKLQARGELENTFIIFTSDNGPTSQGHDHTFFASSGGLNGYKRDLYEGGIRVPGIVYWPGKIEGGKATDFQASFHDLMPTLAEVAGITTPQQSTGTSFLNEMIGYDQTEQPHHYWSVQLPGGEKSYRQAVRMGKWKGVRYANKGTTELYDLETDINETRDLSNKHPDIVKKINRIILTESKKDPRYPFAGQLAGETPQ